jgi:predicted AlkP superfamily pyrophosphatase or phosphodiesterase
MTPRLKDELKAPGLLGRFEAGSGPVRDGNSTEAACRILRDRKPALLTLHVQNLDGTHHAYGPQSGPGYTAAAMCVALVGRVLAALDEASIRERTTVFVVSDHGFIAVTKMLRPNAILRKEGLLEVAESPGRDRIVRARVQVVPEGGIGIDGPVTV